MCVCVRAQFKQDAFQIHIFPLSLPVKPGAAFAQSFSQGGEVNTSSHHSA